MSVHTATTGSDGRPSTRDLRDRFTSARIPVSKDSKSSALEQPVQESLMPLSSTASECPSDATQTLGLELSDPELNQYQHLYESPSSKAKYSGFSPEEDAMYRSMMTCRLQVSADGTSRFEEHKRPILQQPIGLSMHQYPQGTSDASMTAPTVSSPGKTWSTKPAGAEGGVFLLFPKPPRSIPKKEALVLASASAVSQ